MTSWTTVFRVLFSVVLLLSSLPAQGQESGFVLNDETARRLQTHRESFSFFENKETKVDLPTLLKRELRTMESSVPNFGFIVHDVWFRTHITNSSSHVQELTLALSNPNLDVADLFLFDTQGNLLSLQRYSDKEPFSKRRPLSRKPTFTITVPADEKIFLLLKVNNGGEQFHFDISFRKQYYHEQRETSEAWFLGIFFGILGFTILLNIYMLILNRELLSLYYSLYLIAGLFLQLSLLGYGKMYLWPDSAFMSNHANPLFASVSVFFLLEFSRRYLNLENTLPRFDTIFAYISYPIGLCVILALLPFDSTYQLSITMINALTLILNIFILPVAWMVVRRGYKPALLFLFAFLILVLSVFAFILKNFGVIPSNFLTDFGFQIGSVMEVLLFSIGIIIRYRNVQREAISRLEEINKLKEEANEVLEKKVEERTSEIERQKVELQQKNVEIISSIAYAQRIQKAILPDSEKLRKVLPQAKILFLPKDIVSGDFYWIEEKQIGAHRYRFFAVADCTGHGVPGAMMSVLCHNVLNRCLETMDNPNAAELLEKADDLLEKELAANEHAINDGMDISLGVLEPETREFYWAGANNPLWILRNGELIEYDAVRRPIGFGGSKDPFELVRIQLEIGDRLLLFSDGIVDQFGGPDGKKLRKKQFREWIDVCKELPTETMLDHFSNEFLLWKGEQEQTDDVCVMILEFN